MFDKLKIWLRGDSNWKAEQELDRLGKDDAFLGDAMDGYRAVPEGDHAAAVKDLKARLAQRSRKKQGFIYWRSIAAAAVLVGVIGLFFWTLGDFGSVDTIADASPLEKEKVNAMITDQSETMAASMDSVMKTKKEEIAVTKTWAENTEASDKLMVRSEPAERQEKFKVDPSNIEAGIMEEESDELHAYDAIVRTVEEAEPQFEDMRIAKEEAVELAVPPVMAIDKIDKETTFSVDEVAPAPPAAIAIEQVREADMVLAAKKQSEPARISGIEAKKPDTSVIPNKLKMLEGRVTDMTSGESLIGASILIKDTREGAISNFDGDFTLQSYQPLPWTILVSYTGYTDQELEVSSLESPLLISLENEDLALESITVNSYGSRKEKRSQQDNSQSPQPKSSFKKLERYIKNNLKYPETARLNRVEGEVMVKFYINAEGNPEQLTVPIPLGSGFDEEAMRLIETGPKWKPMNTWATYTVKFKL